MSSIKILLYTQKKYANGTSPIIIQIIQNRKIFKKVIHRCLPQHWDAKQNKVKSSAPNYAEINKLISTTTLEYEKKVIAFKETHRSITSEIFDDSNSLTIAEAATKESERLEKLKRFTASSQYDSLSTQLAEFSKNTSIKVINKEWLDNFVAYLIARENAAASIMKKISRIRSLIERYSPEPTSFEIKKYRIPVTEKLKEKLTKEELDAIINLNLPQGDKVEVVRDFFLLQVYLRGVRVGDLLQATMANFTNGRFVYCSDKTNTNYDLSIIPAAQQIIEKYSVLSKEKLFPLWSWKSDPHLSEDRNEKARIKHKESCTAVINKYLKLLSQMAGINKNLTSHVARHTFAMLADEAIGGQVAIVQQMLGHSKRSTTEKYIKSLRKTEELDKAADDIFKNIL